ncbi:fibrinogen alpha chain-like [Dendropsophus ebraccatus]|uniref:fibrinogen alpha chain-like n=1 Tax=Dendropsophus ebraccatus TaxID=150705 RepID=UPI0038322190
MRRMDKAQRTDCHSPSWQVSGCPSGCWVQGLITKAEREILSRVDSARLSGATSNSHSIKLLAEIKRLHEVTGGNGRAETETVKNVANLGNKLRKKLNDLKLKVKEQVRDLRRLHSAIEEQLAAMRRLEVDLDIKFRTCKGSCENVQVFMTSLEKYESWENDMKRMGKYPTDETKTLRDIRLVTQPQKTNATSFSELWPLLDMKELEMLESDDQCRLKLEDV